ncbi:AraC family transcriptional regulator [Sphingobium sp.]|uniref:AraC family transcriptional regulator n=1 Tax=Sphingobium sp. TaxID=1912891 RepID=UPI002ECFCC50
MTDLIRGMSMLHFSDLVVSMGGDADAILREQGIDPSLVGEFDFLIPYRSYAAAIGEAALSLERPDFGLCLGARQGISILGPVAVLIRHSETVDRAIEGVCRYLYSCAPPDVATLERSGRSAIFTLSIALRQVAYREQMVEKGLTIAMDAFRFLLGEDFVPRKVTMQHRRISSQERYREQFGCAVEFESDVNSVHLPNEGLDKPIRGRDAAALALAENYLARISPALGLVDHVREMIHRLLKVNHATLVVVAHEMGLHPRVLQRNLADDNTSFEELLDNVRRDMSWQLSATGMQVGQIATMLGYAEQSSYSRACRRWYNESPRDLIARRRRIAASR